VKQEELLKSKVEVPSEDKLSKEQIDTVRNFGSLNEVSAA
jgi:hypothetical protein